MENIAETPRTIFAKNKYSCAEERIAQLYLLFVGAISSIYQGSYSAD